MTGKAVKRPRRATVWLLFVLGLLALGFAWDDLRQLLIEAAAKVTPWAVLAMLPGQFVAALLCAGGLWALRPGVSYWGSLGSRLLRDAADGLPLLFPGLGEVIGARALVLAGGRTRAAVTASALDKLSEALAQLPYIALAVVVLLRGWHRSLPALAIPRVSAAVVVAVLAGLLLLLLLIRRVARTRSSFVDALVGRIRSEWALLAQELHEQKSGLPLATGFHFVAWAMGGLQFWMGAWALGLDISLFEAIAIESIAYAGRAIVFFIPAGLVMQEAALVAGGLTFGLTAEQSLALALVLRLRDVVLSLPLLSWPAYEYRHRRKGGERTAQ